MVAHEQTGAATRDGSRTATRTETSVATRKMPRTTPPPRRRLRVRRALVALFVALVVWEAVAWGAARVLIVREDLSHADAIAVLAGSAAYLERTHLAVRLYAEGRAPVVLLTNDGERGGWSSPEQRNPFFIERAIDELVARGVPRERITVLPGLVFSTYDEARALGEYAAAHNVRSLVVVTSAYHTRRARWIVRRVTAGDGVEIGVVPAGFSEQTPAPSRWWLSGRGWQSVAVEYAKLVYYHFHY